MPASSVRIPDDEIIRAFARWKRVPEGRTADDLALELGISKSTMYKVATAAGLVRKESIDAGYHERLKRIETMLETLLSEQGYAVPAPLERTGGLKKRVSAAA